MPVGRLRNNRVFARRFGANHASTGSLHVEDQDDIVHRSIVEACSMLQVKPGVNFGMGNVPRNSKLVLVSAGIGIILAGVLTRYLRRRYFTSTSAAVNGDVRRALCAQCRRPSLHHRAITGAKPLLSADQLGHMGLESLEVAISCWEDSLAALHKNMYPGRLDQGRLKSLLAEAQLLHAHCRAVLVGELPLPPSTEVSQAVPSTYDTDSFVSAEGISDVATLSDVEQPSVPLEQCQLYMSSMELLERGAIPCRSYRLEMLCCSTENEYLIKVHCVRLAFQHLTEQDAIRHWLISAGSQVLGALMLCTGRDPKEALQAYDDLLVYLLESQHFEQTEKELLAKGVVCTTVYDVCIDYMLLDAFEDLSNPPASVVAVIQNRWLTTGFKETALAAAIWSVLKAKRTMLPYSDGFFSRYYTLMEHVTPVLAWGFLGTNEQLRELCYYFKEEVESLVRDMFDLGRTRYTTVEDMAEDIFHNTQVCYDRVCQALSAAAP